MRFELLRTLRNRRFFFFSLGFPLVLYFADRGPEPRRARTSAAAGISAPLYFMVGLVAFGTMNAMLSSGARIAGERAVGWNRQLRITPLSTRAYFRAKVLTAYLMALRSARWCSTPPARRSGVSLAGRASGCEMTGLILVGLIPFAALGIVIGHLLTPDSIGPAMGGGDRAAGAARRHVVPDHRRTACCTTSAQALPSYWLVQAGHVALGGAAWGDARLDRHGRVVDRARTARDAGVRARYDARLRLPRRMARVHPTELEKCFFPKQRENIWQRITVARR